MSASPQPIITGTLRSTPLAEFLVQAYDGGLEGTLLLQTADKQKSAIWFSRGAPAKTRLHDKSITLGEVVSDLGLIDAELARSTGQQAEESGRLHGELMLERGYIDQSGLFLSLREQLVRQVLSLCRLQDTTSFGLYRENFLETWGHEGQWRAKPLRLIWRALVDYLPDERRRAWAAKLAETALRLRQEAPVSRYGLTKQEEAVVDLVRVRSGTLKDLIESGVGSEEQVTRVACGLLLTRQLDLGFKEDPVGLHEPAESPHSLPPPEARAGRRTLTAPRAPLLPGDHLAGQSFAPSASPQPGRLRGSTPSSNDTPPSNNTPLSNRETRPNHDVLLSVPPQQTRTATPPVVRLDRGHGDEAMSVAEKAFAAEVKKFEEQPPKNYYEVLGLERGADAAQVRTAFFQLARKWHPDKLASSLAQLRPTVTRAFAEMGEAHQTLMDESKRANYDQGLNAAPDDEQMQVAAILRAASAHQRAEIFYKKKSFPEALTEAKVAYDIDATQPDYVALYAWLSCLVNPDQDPSPQIEMMSRILETTPDHVRTLWYRGQLYKKTQQTNLAMRDFAHILKIKPSHIDAAREIRVHQIKRQTGPKSPSSPQKPTGLFGSFRKKT